MISAPDCYTSEFTARYVSLNTENLSKWMGIAAKSGSRSERVRRAGYRVEPFQMASLSWRYHPLGGACAGPPSKKSPPGRAYDPPHRRKRDKSATASGSDLVTARRDSRLQYNFNWDTLSAVAGITFYSFYFRLYKGTGKSAQVIDFLQALLQHLSGPLLIAWDRLSAHRSRITRDFMAAQGQRLWVEYLPG